MFIFSKRPNLKSYNFLKMFIKSKFIMAPPGAGGGALEWQEGVSGSSMDTQKAP